MEVDADMVEEKLEEEEEEEAEEEEEEAEQEEEEENSSDKNLTTLTWQVANIQYIKKETYYILYIYIYIHVYIYKYGKYMPQIKMLLAVLG